MAEMKDVVGSLLGRWAVPALKLIQIVSFLQHPARNDTIFEMKEINNRLLRI